MPKSKTRVKKNKRKAVASKPVKKPSFVTHVESDVVIGDITVTHEPIENEEGYPEEVDKQKDALHDLIFKAPKKAIPKLELLNQKYPEIRELYNWLAAAYAANKQSEKSEQMALLCFQKFPDYFFAKLNYAEICLRKDELDKVAEVLENKFELKQHYPDRNVFHLTEFVSFMGLTGRYFAEIKQIEKAQACLDKLREVAPEHSTTMQLALVLMPSMFAKLLGK